MEEKLVNRAVDLGGLVVDLLEDGLDLLAGRYFRATNLGYSYWWR